MLKKILSLILAAVFLIALIPATVSSETLEMDFKDVAKGKWYYSYVKYVYENGLMVGTSKTTFEPNGKLTRGMFVTILCRLDGGVPKVTDKFVDVPAGKWYAPYVGWASETGLVNGYPGGLFKPDAYLTRQEMAAITDRYIAYKGINMPRRFTAPSEFTDSAKIAKWAKGNMENLRRAGIFNGDNAGKCNPTASITRAETATVVKNLIDAQALAWQGYDPVTDDGPVILGAKYLYENASQIRGTLGTEIDLSGSVPTLDAYYDSYRAGYTSDFHYPGFYGAKNRMNSVGVSVTGIKLDMNNYPVMKVAYSYVDYDEPETLEGSYQHNFEEEYGTSHAHRDPFAFVKGENDGDFRTATFDFTEKFASDTFDFDYDILNLLVCPFDEDYRGVLDGLPDGKFKIAYIGFFPDQASADTFTMSSAPDAISDYLDNYFLYSELDWREADDATLEQYDSLLTDRISEILNSESEVTPADIKKGGGKVYYISSFRGDDSNDGLTPETPWKSISMLWEYRTSPVMQLRRTKLKAGDGVFFERGSIFYPERYGKNMAVTLDLIDDVTYGAYGKGPKPQFTHALDFGAVRSDEGATGTWLPTEWENVWLLDGDVGFWEDENDDSRGQKSTCGNLVINHGEYVGVRMLSTGQNPGHDIVEPFFSPSGKTKYYGYMCNGKEWFECGGTPMTNPGTALTHNLEYITDNVEHKLYLYCDMGNPGDVFDDIKVSTEGYVIMVTGNLWEDPAEGVSRTSDSQHGKRLDNLSILYSGMHGAMLAGDGLVVSNCEIGWCGGAISSMESGMESYGTALNESVYNCYLHDIGDGPLSTQHGGEWSPGAKPRNFENIEYYDNVIICSGNAVESICENESARDETGIYGLNKQIDFHVHDNIFAYIGYGMTEQQSDMAARQVRLYLDGEAVEAGVHKGGEVFCTTGEKVNSVIENNLVMYTCGNIWSTDVSTDAHRRGWITRDNTYVNDNRYTIFIQGDADVDRFILNESIKKFTNEEMPYNERYLSYFASKGIDEGSTFYWYESDDFNLPFRGAFMTGWYAERGLKPANSLGG